MSEISAGGFGSSLIHNDATAPFPIALSTYLWPFTCSPRNGINRSPAFTVRESIDAPLTITPSICCPSACIQPAISVNCFFTSNHTQSIVYCIFCFSAWRSRASSISLSINSGYETPVFCQSSGNMLVGVNPGIVFTSLISTSSFAVTKKSARTKTEQSRTL